MGNPYVISAELDLANANLEQIVRQERIEGFRESLDANLRSIGKETVWVQSSTMQSGLENALRNTRLPVVSLDERYVTTADEYIGISRGVDEQLNDVGYVARVGYRPIQEQLGKISALGSEIIVADDVLFSGEMITWLADALEQRGVKIGGLVCGIAIQEGIEKLETKNIDVAAIETFDEVEDEICERDFAVVPGSGRRIESVAANALYFDPVNGKPTQWASIPANMVEGFAYDSYMRSADLLQPNLRIADIGNFYGWGTGNAEDILNELAMWSYAKGTGVPPVA